MAEAMAPVDPGRHEWHRTMAGWHVAFVVLAALTGGLLLLDDGLTPPRRAWALAGLGALCIWYLVMGVKALHHERSGLGAAYVAAAVPLTVGMFAIAAASAVMLFLLYPHIWALMPIRRAIVATVLTVCGTAFVTLLHYGLTPQVLLFAAVALVCALVLGVWITRIIEQSAQRARLVAELAATRAELARVSREAGVLAERQRLARDIHDTLAQGFASVLLLFEAMQTEIGRDGAAALKHLELARQIARDNLAEARHLVAALTPPKLAGSSLPDALRELVDRFEKECSVTARLAVTGEPHRQPADEEVALLRAAQEALANARKHASPTRVEVHLSYHDSGVTLRVSDDGRGFVVGHDGFGLAGMRERVGELGGRVTVESSPTSGTTVLVELAR